jgi:hypothetical protein
MFIEFQIGIFQEQVLCDVIEMDACTYYWEDHGCLIDKFTMMVRKTHMSSRKMVSDIN